MKTLKFIVSVVLMVIVAQVVHTIGAMMAMRYYMDPNLAQVWSKVMMPSAGPPPASFFYLSLGLGLILWAVFIAVYIVMKNGVPGKGALQKGLMFGLLIFLVSGLSGAIGMFLTVNIPKGLNFMWTVESLIILLANGVIAASLNS
jgi:hypothetical protein